MDPCGGSPVCVARTASSTKPYLMSITVVSFLVSFRLITVCLIEYGILLALARTASCSQRLCVCVPESLCVQCVLCDCRTGSVTGQIVVCLVCATGLTGLQRQISRRIRSPQTQTNRSKPVHTCANHKTYYTQA